MADSGPVPGLTVVTTGGEEMSAERAATQVKASDSCHIDMKNFRKPPDERQKEEQKWLCEQNISQYYNYVLEGMTEKQPAEPLQFFQSELRRAESLDEALKADLCDHPLVFLKRAALSSDDVGDYLQDHGVQGVWEDLVAAVLRDQPKDPVQYTQAWLRLNARHAMDAATTPCGPARAQAAAAQALGEDGDAG